jgi:tetratricopeptide (TPR) repeat protein
MYRRIAQYHEALRYFSEVQETLQDDKTVYIQRGLVYQDMGNNWQAIKDFKHAIQLQENYSPAHFYLGISLLKDHKPVEALKEFTQASLYDTNNENPGI